VALRVIHRLVLWGFIPPVSGHSPATPGPESPGGHALSSPVEYATARHSALSVSLLSGDHHHPDPAVAGHTRIRSRPDWACGDLVPASPGSFGVCSWTSATGRL